MSGSNHRFYPNNQSKGVYYCGNYIEIEGLLNHIAISYSHKSQSHYFLFAYVRDNSFVENCGVYNQNTRHVVESFVEVYLGHFSLAGDDQVGAFVVRKVVTPTAGVGYLYVAPAPVFRLVRKHTQFLLQRHPLVLTSSQHLHRRRWQWCRKVRW